MAVASFDDGCSCFGPIRVGHDDGDGMMVVRKLRIGREIVVKKDRIKIKNENKCFIV